MSKIILDKTKQYLLFGWLCSFFCISACDRQNQPTPQSNIDQAQISIESESLSTFAPNENLHTPQIPESTTTQQPYVTPTIFPVITPLGTASEYQLKEWTEPLALELVNKAERYAQGFLHADMDWILQRNGFQKAHEIIELAAKEAIVRFPETQSKERLEWLIVLSECQLSVTGYRKIPNDRIAALLESGLNDGNYDLQNLNSSLNPFGFEIRQQTAYSESIPTNVINFFGENETVSLIVISRIAPDPLSLLGANETGFVDDDGFIFIIRQNEQGFYSPLLVESGWSFPTSGFERITVNDVTLDGIPEIEVVFYVHNGSMYDREIKLWQWQEDHLVDVVDGILMPGPSDWNYSSSNLDNQPVLQTSQYINGVGGPITTTYGWDGKMFEPISIEFTDWPDDVAVPTLPSSKPTTQNTPVPEKTITREGIIQIESLFFENKDIETAISSFEQFLADPNTEEIYSRPRLYYLLALAYELSDDHVNAIQNYWYLWQNYPDSPYAILAQAKLEIKP